MVEEGFVSRGYESRYLGIGAAAAQVQQQYLAAVGLANELGLYGISEDVTAVPEPASLTLALAALWLPFRCRR